MVRLGGFEPTALAFAGPRSIQLSYKRTMVPKGRLELPYPLGHYALNVARLPVPPLRLETSESRNQRVIIARGVLEGKLDGLVLGC